MGLLPFCIFLGKTQVFADPDQPTPSSPTLLNLQQQQEEQQKLLEEITDSAVPAFKEQTVPKESSHPSALPKSLVKLEKYCKKHPKSWEGKYNLGVEQYRLMDYTGAKKSFSEAIQICQNPEQQEKTFYNLGNACFRQALSMPEDQQIPLLEESLQNYENALAIRKSEDTQHNIEVVKKHLKKRKKQQQKKQQQPQKNKQNKDQKKDPKKEQQDKENKEKKDDNKNESKDDKKDKPKDQPPKKKDEPNKQQQEEEKKVDLKQQEMDNILNREKRIEKMLPPSSNQNSNDPIIKDW